MKKRADHRASLRARLRQGFQRRILTALALYLRLRSAQDETTRKPTSAPTLAVLVEVCEELADAMVDIVITYVELLVEGRPNQAAVLDRAELVEGWDLMSHGLPKLPAHLRNLAVFLAIREQAAGVKVMPWPSNVSPDDVTAAYKHAAAIIKKNPALLGHVEPQDLVALQVPAFDVPLPAPAILPALLAPWPMGIGAHVVSIAKRVDAERRREAMAIDAGGPHHNLVTGMRNLPKDAIKHTGAPLPIDAPKRGPDGVYRTPLLTVHRKRSRAATRRPDRFEVIAPGLAVQVAFPFDEKFSVSIAMIETLKRWRGPLNTWKGPEGLRHWAALLRLLSIEGAREGHVRWTMERHLEAIGASEDTRHDPESLQEIGGIVELLTKLELAVYAPDGTLRLRQTILSAMSKIDRKHGATWALEGMELVIHPLLYDGVRKPNGDPGTNWFPQAAELAKIDHVRFPNAIALGLVLPIRWRWDWGDGRDHTILSGAKLLETAGITYKLRHMSAAWKKLRRTLEKLIDIAGLGRFEWEGEPWTLGALCHLYPPQWARDRTVHALPPVETPPAAFRSPMTGDELAAWRRRENLTQAAAATRLGVGLRTIERAENAEATPLGWALRKAFNKLATV